MLDPAVMAPASAAGVAVAQAAGTDAWKTVRERVARLFGRDASPGDTERVALKRLERTEAQLQGVAPDASERERSAAVWETRFHDLLESLGEADFERAVAQLRELVSSAGPGGGVSAGKGGVAIGGNAHVRAENQAAAAVTMGDVTIGNPPTPGPDRA
ncbi:hypothetical protein ACWC3X_42055 [Streptomyces populi]